MTTIPIYGGPSKGDIQQMARETCGQCGYTFDGTPEEVASDLRRLDAMMQQWKVQRGVDLGYNFTSYGTGLSDEESGIPSDCLEVVASSLARRIAPGIGKQLGAEANATYSEALGLMLSTYAKLPVMAPRSTTPRGSGNRWGGTFGDYFTGGD